MQPRERLRRRRERRRMANLLVAECEAFVAGQYADRLKARGEVVPVWAWTNLLAHGCDADLRAAAATAPLGPEGRGGWEGARAQLAVAVLAATGPQCSLDQLQAEVLAPLEMRLAVRSAAARWDRRTWAAAVRAALAEHRPSRQA
jgi:hypothetical protein